MEVMVVVGSMLLATGLCAKYWELSALFKSLPIIVGTGLGIFFSCLEYSRGNGENTFSILAGSVIVGVVFWFSVWVEARRGNDRSVS